ncbi:hypothetical protein [Conexibacter sp. SYSU D00693]|uniref:hypothetical protein n=1 Tax=Conexibacter sp. SYSU D00693 TaxID=2812560 RepID=UPI00196ACCF6|nr:hypothetical protein [Conexibacter sp. SYSU D00693]
MKTPHTIAAALLTGAALMPPPAHAAKYFPALVAGAKTDSGGSFGTSLRLPLRTDDFQLIRRTSRSSITLGFPKSERVTRKGRRVTVKAKPCATVTYRLSIRPGRADPLTVVRQAVPDAGTEGTERGVRVGEPVETQGPPRRAWRIANSFDSKGRLHSHGRSVEQLLPADPFGPPVDALRTITFTARMLHLGGACGGADSFTLGPGVPSPVELG